MKYYKTVSVEDELPPQVKEVAVFYGIENEMCGGIYGGKNYGGFYDAYGYNIPNVTHWLKEIELPTEEEIEKVISEVENMHPYKQSGNRDSYSDYNQVWSAACDILGEKIKELLNQKR